METQELEGPFMIAGGADRERGGQYEGGDPELRETAAQWETPAIPSWAGGGAAPLRGSVGKGAQNGADDVRRVQARLAQLGMDWVAATGTIAPNEQDPTVRAIRLFNAMVGGVQIWSKRTRKSPCPVNEVVPGSGVIHPGSDGERWLWSATAPRWCRALPADRRGWTGLGDRMSSPGISSWAVAYLNDVGSAFARKLEVLRPLLDVFATQGRGALDRLAAPKPQYVPRGPWSGYPGDAALEAAVAQRVLVDLADVAVASNQDGPRLAAQTRDAIASGRVVVTLTSVSQPEGGCTEAHATHQAGLEIDIRLFSHDGPRDGMSLETSIPPAYSRLLTGIFLDVVLEHRMTENVLFNDKVLQARSNGRVQQVAGHYNHIHIGIHGGNKRTPTSLAAPAVRAPQQLVPENEHCAAACPRCGAGLANREEALLRASVEEHLAPSTPLVLPGSSAEGATVLAEIQRRIAAAPGVPVEFADRGVHVVALGRPRPYVVVKGFTQTFTGSALRTDTSNAEETVINMNLFGLTSTEGQIVRTGSVIGGQSSPGTFYLAWTRTEPDPWKVAQGDPPRTADVAFGGGKPVIVNGVCYGAVNRYSAGAPAGLPATGDPGEAHRGLLLQRSNAGFAALDALGPLVGKVITALDRQQGIFFILVQQDRAAPGMTLTEIRDALLRLGVDDALAWDGSTSATLVRNDKVVIAPSGVKDRMIGYGMGLQV